ncbi:agamous-like MADS-box protein AGL80 [Impatiens glandulifera]|uniref:agamous-like MADS-box protein AGL80 n=1 Tax=Impatiens glandulifera TaxID=253017 RepID=UPI001FB17A21|nr:agamous-like MADS-box protein AGL80 [Impatiens glandulifera]
MGRSKVKYSYILNHTLRRNTLRKRRLCVAKKLYELTTLCDVEACTVIYSEIDSEPFVWPSIDEVRRLITKYHTFSKAERGKRKVNQETFTRQRLGKTEEMLRRQQRENRRNQMTYIMYQSMINPQTAMSRLNVDDFVELDRVTGQNLEEVTRMMATFNPPPPPPQFGADGSGVVGGSQDEFMPPNYGGFDSLVAPQLHAISSCSSSSFHGVCASQLHGISASSYGFPNRPIWDFHMTCISWIPPTWDFSRKMQACLTWIPTWESQTRPICPHSLNYADMAPEYPFSNFHFLFVPM